MSNSKESLEGLVSKLKEQGITAGTEEKNRIIEEAKAEAAKIIADAEKRSKKMVDDATKKAAQMQENAETSIAQASRDMLEATRIAVMNYLKSVFGKQSEKLFTQEQYSMELLKAVIEVLPGDKTVRVKDDVLKKMEAFILKEALKDKVVLQPLGENSTKIVVEANSGGDVNLVLSAKDIEDGMFSMLNKELVERITARQGKAE